MEGFNKLIEKLKKSPKKSGAAVKATFDKLPEGEMSKTVTFDVPKEYAPLFDQFKAICKGEKPAKGKKVPKANPKKIMEKMKGNGEKVTVTLDLPKLKSFLCKTSAHASEQMEDKPMEESISLLDSYDDDEYYTEDAALVAFGAAYMLAVILDIALFVYCVYVVYLCITTGTILGDEDNPNFGTFLGNVLLATFFTLIWCILVHIKVCKKRKNGQLKESYEPEDGDDSIVTMMEEFSDETGKRLAIDNADHDSELIEAYRKVVADLSYRIPKDIDPMD